MTRPLLLVALASLLAGAARAAEPPGLTPEWEASLTEYLEAQRRPQELMGVADPAGLQGELRGLMTPALARLGETRTAQLAHGRLGTRVLDSATPEGRQALLSRLGVGLGPGRGLELRPGVPAQRVRARLGQRLGEVELAPPRAEPLPPEDRFNPRTGELAELPPELARAPTHGEVAGTFHQELSGAVLATMLEVPDPEGLDAAGLAAWHRFFRAGEEYLATAALSHGVAGTPEDPGLARARARAEALEGALAELGVYDPAADAYDLDRLEALERELPAEDEAPGETEDQVAELPAASPVRAAGGGVLGF